MQIEYRRLGGDSLCKYPNAWRHDKNRRELLTALANPGSSEEALQCITCWPLLRKARSPCNIFTRAEGNEGDLGNDHKEAILRRARANVVDFTSRASCGDTASHMNEEDALSLVAKTCYLLLIAERADLRISVVPCAN